MALTSGYDWYRSRSEVDKACWLHSFCHRADAEQLQLDATRVPAPQRTSQLAEYTHIRRLRQLVKYCKTLELCAAAVRAIWRKSGSNNYHWLTHSPPFGQWEFRTSKCDLRLVQRWRRSTRYMYWQWWLSAVNWSTLTMSATSRSRAASFASPSCRYPAAPSPTRSMTSLTSPR